MIRYLFSERPEYGIRLKFCVTTHSVDLTVDLTSCIHSVLVCAAELARLIRVSGLQSSLPRASSLESERGPALPAPPVYGRDDDERASAEHETAEDGATAATATDTVMGAVFGGVWNWATGQDLLPR